jgi:hypothetical protein
MKAEWYRVIHDLLPTKVRLQKIQLAETNNCNECGKVDSRLHRLIECGERSAIWTWTRQRIAWILRTIPTRNPEEWIIRPHFTIWPQRRNRAVSWMLAHMVWYNMQTKRHVSLQDYYDFMRRARWKEDQWAGREQKLAQYLSVIGQ